MLGRHGIAPGPAGYELGALEAAAAARGWQCQVEELAGARPGARGLVRYRALVFARSAEGLPSQAQAVLGHDARGRGRTEAEALA